MDLRTIIVTNSVSVALLLILLYTARAKTLRDRAEDRLFSIMVIGVMLGSIMETLSYLIDGKVFVGARVLNYVMNTYLFSANTLLPFFLLIYVDLCLYGKKKRIWKHYKPQIIIGAAMITVNIINFFVPISYVINENNSYERRPLSYLYYVVIVFYLISIFFLIRKYKKHNGARVFLSVWMFIIPVIVGAGLQFLFYGMSLAWLSSAIGLLGLFMMQQNEMAFIDPLVHLYNRQYMDSILSYWISRNRSFAGVMVDVDKFKSINDTYGHSEGDKALTTLSKILKQSGSDEEWLFRFAGDEFIVLKLTDSPSGLDDFVKEVDRQVELYNSKEHLYKLSISYGISFFSEGSIDTFMREMDERMYEMKEKHHSELAELQPMQ